MARISLRATIGIRGINPYIPVDKPAAERLKKDWRKAMPVRLRVKGRAKQRWSTNLMPAGDGSFYLYLHGEIRRASGVDVGEAIEVRLEFDRTYRQGPAHPIPMAFARELKANRQAEKAWSELTPSRQKEILRYLAALKSPQALERNVRKAIEVLSGVEVRFMASNWNDKT